jgi:hypothetical protein
VRSHTAGFLEHRESARRPLAGRQRSLSKPAAQPGTSGGLRAGSASTSWRRQRDASPTTPCQAAAAGDRRTSVRHDESSHGAMHFLTKTLQKIAGEMALTVLAYNLTRVMKSWHQAAGRRDRGLKYACVFAADFPKAVLTRRRFPEVGSEYAGSRLSAFLERPRQLLRAGTRYCCLSGATALTPPVCPIAPADLVDFAGSGIVLVATTPKRPRPGLGVSSSPGALRLLPG